ncbi:MAG TPA: hypothetical protein VNB23_06615 [Ramlibacter sp.]|nr:hypothetical protein [Ramlibacter sp.]
MNTQPLSHTLLAGQAMQLPQRGAAPAVLVQGEVLLQPPAAWLAGELVLPPPVRLVSPALLPSDAAGALVAVHEAVVVVHEAPTLRAALMALLARVRAWRGVAAPPAWNSHA